jgi:hypothetical protein
MALCAHHVDSGIKIIHVNEINYTLLCPKTKSIFSKGAAFCFCIQFSETENCKEK